MKILISHSWNDKSPATLLKQQLEVDRHEVWYDIHDMIEGDPIQITIDRYLNDCDVMVLVWSRNALASAGVDQEIKTAKAFGKRIIPVLTDETPLDDKPELAGLLGVPAQNWEVGCFIVRRALLLLMVPEAYKESPWFREAFHNVKELGGYLKYVQTYRIPGQKNEDGYKEDWKILLERLKEENERIRDIVMTKTRSDMEQLQAIMAQLEAGNNSREQLEEWLYWCKNNENAQTDMMCMLGDFLEKDLQRLAAGGTPVRSLDTDIVRRAIDRLQTAVDTGKDRAAKNIGEKINAFTFGLLGTAANQKITQGLLQYIVYSPVILEKMLQEAQASEYVAVKEVLINIAQYLEGQDHIAEASKADLEGYFDDAFLINNAAKLLSEVGLVSRERLGLDFVSAHITDKYFALMIPMETKQQLNRILEELRQLIGLKKKEVNWGVVAAVLVGSVLVAKGVQQWKEQKSDAPSARSFEDKVADFSAKYGGGLDAHHDVNYDT